jgi:hypothetical protein
MAEDPGYQSQLSLEAAAFLVAQPRRKQRQLLDLADGIAHDPFAQSDYRITDEKGRMVENRLLQGFLFSYRVDHAVCEVLITDIIQV